VLILRGILKDDRVAIWLHYEQFSHSSKKNICMSDEEKMIVNCADNIIMLWMGGSNQKKVIMPAHL